MLEGIIKKASELNLGPSSNQSPSLLKTTSAGRPKSRSVASGRFSNKSGALRSDDDFSSIGYSFEGQDHEGIAASPLSTDRPGCSRTDPGTSPVVFDVDRSGEQTLGSLKAEAIKDRTKLSRSKRSRFT